MYSQLKNNAIATGFGSYIGVIGLGYLCQLAFAILLFDLVKIKGKPILLIVFFAFSLFTLQRSSMLGLIFAIAIILHNIPEGISISVPIYYSKKSKKKAFLYTMISGLSEPLGALLSMIFLYKYISNFLIAILFSLIAGLMSYISIFELMKTSFKYDKNKIYILYGSFFILIVEILLKI